MPAVLTGQTPHRPARHGPSFIADLVGEEPVPELRVVLVGIKDGVRQPGFIQLGVGERLLPPPLVLLSAQAEDPA